MAWWVSPAAVGAQTAARASARASELGVIAIDPLVRECLTRAQHLPRADQTHPQPPHAGLAPGGPLPQQRKQLREVAPPHQGRVGQPRARGPCAPVGDRKSTRLNSSHSQISYAVFCLKKKKNTQMTSARMTCTAWAWTL